MGGQRVFRGIGRQVVIFVGAKVTLSCRGKVSILMLPPSSNVVRTLDATLLNQAVHSSTDDFMA